MNCRERENATLNFSKNIDRGSVEETFYPWTMTLERWSREGLPQDITENIWKPAGWEVKMEDVYLGWLMADGTYNFEKYFGFDGVKRLGFNLPLWSFETKVIEECEGYTVKQCNDGWHKKFYKNKNMVEEIKPAVTCNEDWEKLKERCREVLDEYYADENIRRIYCAFKEGHKRGEYSIRMNIPGFFWTPRTLMGIEEHLYGFYDEPQLIHAINEFVLEIYLDKLGKILDILPADVLYIMEDLSGANGPMLSCAHFDEFIGVYYKRLVPFLKEHGVRNVFVDTDGDFTKLIPNFMEAGVEGFLPMDVNAGVDIVEVRKAYPELKFIGGFNKLEIAKGKEAIDKEFERLLPVIRQGGYIPGADHQVAPSTSLEDYMYYVKRLKEVMMEACR